MSSSIAAVSLAADRDWGTYLGDAGATHFSTLKSINTANVKQLVRAWEFRTGDLPPGNRSQIQCNPLVIDGVLYGTTPALSLVAVDAATGRERWRFKPANESGARVPQGINRGLAWWSEGDEKRLLFGAGRFLHAIDPATGKLIPTFGAEGKIDLLDELDCDASGFALAATTPGAVYRDLIIMPMRLAENLPAAPGHIRAFDVRTGQRRWIFHTIPHPGEFGYETWPEDAWQKSGAANCWAGLVIDHARGIAFVPTGSAAFDFWGGDRGGDNLFANCLIALDAGTGKRKWHFQFTHHDMWDRDLPSPPVLCEVTRGGKKIAAVAQVTKSGHVWVFDRETGESLFPWSEVPVPPSRLQGEVAAKTQPMPQKPAPFARQVFTEEEATDRTPAARAAVLQRLREVTPHRPWDPPSERGGVILPGFDGGAEWGGPAVDPRGVLYVNGNEMAWILQMVPTAVFGSGPKALYAQLCIGCHGLNREGNAAANIPSLQQIGIKLKPEEIAAQIRTGKGMMPSFNFLPAAVRDALVRFLISPDADDPRNARELIATGPVKGGGSPYVTTGYNRFLDPDGYPALRPPWGTLNALDLNTGEYLWKRPLGELPELTAQGIPPTGTENYGGPVVTAGGVIFIAATKDEKFRAFSAATGELLWETSLPAAGYATPATYEVGGKQYVVIACGGGKIGTKSGESYVAFALP
ncbi:MAG: PQQ-binding-like beta-propeller repeat protein [Verrucomicrobia bacterium]|nr:PQQ-binding-like beta-propeller repeat protein [Verrucomicrobiota bacterium]